MGERWEEKREGKKQEREGGSGRERERGSEWEGEGESEREREGEGGTLLLPFEGQEGPSSTSTR